MKSYVRAIAAALAFIALLVYVVIFERGRVPEKGELFGVEVADTTGLEVSGEDLEFSLEKRDGQWYVAKPFVGLANTDNAERRVQTIAHLKPTGTRSGVNLDDDAFGLTKPKLTATLSYARGKQIKIYLGNDTPVGSETYAKIEGHSDLYMLPSTVLSTLKQSADDLREKRLVMLEPSQVRSMLLSHGEIELQVDNSPQQGLDNWQLVKPLQARADEFRTEQLVSRLLEMEAERFVEAGDDAAAEHGFDKPTVTAQLSDAEGKTATVVVGARLAKPDQAEDGQEWYYARVDGRNEVMVVAEADVRELRKQPIDLRDRAIVDIEKTNINFVRVQSKKRFSFAIRRHSDGWHLERPVNAVAKLAKVDDLLWDIAQLEAREYVDEEAGDPKKYGLAVPETIVEIHSTGTDRVLKISFGDAVGDDAYYCMTSDSDQVYVVSDMLLLDLPGELEHIKASS